MLIPMENSIRVARSEAMWIRFWNVFCQHQLSASILADAHPHIGTDKLPRVIENMRNTILECGGEVYFETRMDALIIENDERMH